MRRILVSAAVLLAVGAFLVFTLGASGGGSSPTYKIEVDNAFGLVNGADFKAWVDGVIAIEYTLGAEPSSAKGAPNPDLIPANNAVLRPPVAGKVGLWSKTDSTSYFKDYVVAPN